MTEQREHQRRPAPRRDDSATQLAERFRGELIGRGDERYERRRRLYNGMIDKRPRLIARCRDAADVIAAVELGRSQGWLTAVRGGGHNGPGFGSCDDGLVIDLSPMRGVLVDPESRRVRVQGGAVWGDVDHATHAFGLATPSGILSTTGVGGLTLGGGHGYLSRKYGLTIDNLISADVVLADGSFVRASAHEHDDLFWALRGGGGNFGVVTSFEFRLYPVAMVQAGPTVWPLERAAEVMRWYDGFIGRARREIYGFFAFMVIPPVPPFPEALHGERVCSVMWCCLDPEGVREVREAVYEPGAPVFEHLGEVPYPGLQSLFDDLYPPGMQWYWRGHFVDELGEEAIAVHLEHARALPTSHSTMHLYPIDGAVHDMAEDATAFNHRRSRWSQVIVGVSGDPQQAGHITRWTKQYSDALLPHSTGGGYVNFMMQEGKSRIEASYRGNYARLVEIKRKYDPDNFFRVNQNIDPGAG